MKLLDRLKMLSAEPPAQVAPLRLSEAAKREEKLIDKIARVASEQKHPESVRDIHRICSLPISYPLTEAEIAEVSAAHLKADAPEGFSLRREQAEALFSFEARDQRGLFAPIEVGGGKTLICLRIAAMAAERGIRKSMIVVPPQVLTQLEQRDIPWARKRVPLGVQFTILGGLSREARLTLAQHTARGCFIVPYSLLSTEDSVELLNYIQPQILIFDEAHLLKNRRSARTKRIATYIKNKRPVVVALSGTITNKTIRDYAHTMAWCLGDESPAPLDSDTVAEWAALIDADGKHWIPEQERKVGAGPMRPLIHWSNTYFRHDKLDADTEGFRRAVQNRLLTAPGVVASPAGSLGTTLLIENQPVVVAADYPGMDDLRRLDRDVEEKWTSPSGDQIEWAMHKFAHRYTLSCGFYNLLSWPEPSATVTEEALARAQEHHYFLQQYHCQLREWLKYHNIPGIDTPMTVGNSMARHGAKFVTQTLYNSWLEAKNREFEGMPTRDSRPVRVCDYKIKDAVRWMKAQERGGIVWYMGHGAGDWVAEEARKAGIDAIHCPAGKQFNALLTDAEAPTRFAKTFAICSISAHGTGKNLQYFDRQYFLQFPRPEEVVQQTLGRLHRPGQEADVVITRTNISTEIDEIALAATLNDSVYVFETTASSRKILFANWQPMPSIYGESLLRRAGADAKSLNIRQRKILEEQFGNTRQAVDKRTAIA
jgi:hypothetical protein